MYRSLKNSVTFQHIIERRNNKPSGFVRSRIKKRTPGEKEKSSRVKERKGDKRTRTQGDIILSY